jgi:hypothetical protein
MTDITTRKPLHVIDTEAGPFMDLPFSQVEDVRRLLDANGVYYWVSEHSISFNGGPAMTMVHFGHQGDAAAIQAILDGAN